MGKIYTYIHKGQQNSKCKTVDLSLFLKDGWELGWPNQHDHMVKMSMKAAEKLQTLKENDYEEYLEYQNKRSSNVSKGLYKFWSDVADDEYIQNREIKKQQSRDNWSEEERLLYHNKMSESAKRNRANISSEEYHRRAIKNYETKKKNGTLWKSTFEDESYKELCIAYGKFNIKHQYVDEERYPFFCDFYIKSLDLFIELNMHPSHGPHRFDANNVDDILLVEELKNKGDSWSQCIIDIWTIKDIAKYNYADKYKLNYICVYPDTYNDFISLVTEKRLCDLVS